MRLTRFLMIIGVTLVLLSVISPIIEPSYSAGTNLSPGQFRGWMVNCNSGLDIRISSEFNEPFSVYFMNYENGLRTLENGSLENVTVIHVFSNRTLLNEHISIPVPGWYAILMTPSGNETITFFEVTIVNPVPNPELLLSGVSVIGVGVIGFIIMRRNYQHNE